jgi:hypothetical protein
MAAVSFRFPHEQAFETLSGLASPVTVGALCARVLERRPAAAEALHGSRNLAASGWRMLLTDASTKTEYLEEDVHVPLGAQLVVTLIKARGRSQGRQSPAFL